MKKIFAIVFVIGILFSLGVGIWLGMKWSRIRYVDACLEMGGGIKAGSEVCVVSE